MKKIPLLCLIMILAVPLFSQDVELRDSDLYTTTTQMQGDGYSLSLKETGTFQKIPSLGDGYVLDPDPFGFRDFIPPSAPAGLRGAALDATTIRLTYLAATDNIRVMGYRIYRNDVMVGYSTEEGFTDTGLSPITLYRYNVQAVDKCMNLSELSETAYVVTMDAASQNNPPHFLGGPSVLYATDTAATIGFSTDKATMASVEYGATAAYGQSVAGDEYYSDHIMTITGLTPGTLYHYRVSLTDYSGHGPVPSRDDVFYTSWTTDTTAPRFAEGPRVDYVSDRFAVVTFRTDEEALGTVRYGRRSLSENRVEEAYYGTDHSVILTGLRPRTGYIFDVKIIDRSGNGPTATKTLRFTTRKDPDTKPPLIIGKPREAYVSDRMAIITWVTDELSDSVVRFGKKEEPRDRRAASTVMTRYHMVILHDLEADRMYHYEVSSTDPSGNTGEARWEQRFMTDKSPDNKAPKIRKVLISADETSAVIRWETDELAKSKILYGTGSGQYASQEYDWRLQERHEMELTGLQPDTRYRFQIIATDPSGNQAQTAEIEFRTGHKNHEKEGRDHDDRDKDEHEGRKEPRND